VVSTRPEGGDDAADTRLVVRAVVSKHLGTPILDDAPLMAAGLDSISATELTRVLAERVGLELPSTLLFDHPSVGAVASFIASATCTSPAAVGQDMRITASPPAEAARAHGNAGPIVDATTLVTETVADVVGASVARDVPPVSSDPDSTSATEVT